MFASIIERCVQFAVQIVNEYGLFFATEKYNFEIDFALCWSIRIFYRPQVVNSIPNSHF